MASVDGSGQLGVAGNLDALHPVEVQASDDVLDSLHLGVSKLHRDDIAVHMHAGDTAQVKQAAGQLVGGRIPKDLVTSPVARVTHASEGTVGFVPDDART